MNRQEIREMIKEYLKSASPRSLSEVTAKQLEEYLKARYPGAKLGNKYNIECDFVDFFTNRNYISGLIERCDSFDEDSVIDSVSFHVYDDMSVMAWDKGGFALKLDMDNLSNDDLTDIMHMDNSEKIDLYTTFMRISPKDRGRLAGMIPNSMATELFHNDIPPYAFYKYDGQFYGSTGKGVGDLGGGIGFGGFTRALGSKAEIKPTVISIGEHAFDGCLHLTEVYVSKNVHYIGKHAFANIPGLVIRCGAPSKPATWDDEWCDGGCKVIFGG